jgi:hypothetical protein
VARRIDDGSTLLDAQATGWAAADVNAWGAAPYMTRFRALWTDAALFLRFEAEDDAPWHTMTRRDDPLWEQEVVEVFLDPSRSGVGYAELEISPANVVCDLVVRRPWPDLRSDPSWHIDGLATRVVRWGGREAGGDDWAATARVPWQGLRPITDGVNVPPRPGDTWSFNVFRIKRPGGPAHRGRNAVLSAWSPTGTPSFHVPSAFGSLVFAGPEGRALSFSTVRGRDA